MPTTTANQGWTLPVGTDDPNIVADLTTVVLQIEKQVIGIYTSVSDRNTTATSPLEGQFAYLADTNALTYYTGSAWVTLGNTSRVITVSTSAPSGGSDGDIHFKV